MNTTTKPKLKHEIEWRIQQYFDHDDNPRWSDVFYKDFTDGKQSTAKRLIKKLRESHSHDWLSPKLRNIKWRLVKYKMTISEF